MDEPLVRAAELITRVAALIPLPSESLTGDDTAWSAFEALLGEAATLLAGALGHDGRAVLCALADSPLSANPLCALLMERCSHTF
ncbi:MULTISPECIES: hypothetical protein [Rhodococcus]|uniref:Uncharacterized protein n=1 Tax=Rhodococcus pseudokoreensis TaxID=2811421 RepID=A0A974VZ39_9NOCA|nr:MULTISPECIES: hypothetical protein [Rhodococcus]MBV6757435.1 hypothetical protein [Rhodococcus opacus]QSE88214.1 hypothetical protein JWS13_06070 [Rhodococcus pseudokoreensis]